MANNLRTTGLYATWSTPHLKGCDTVSVPLGCPQGFLPACPPRPCYHTQIQTEVWILEQHVRDLPVDMSDRRARTATQLNTSLKKVYRISSPLERWLARQKWCGIRKYVGYADGLRKFSQSQLQKAEEMIGMSRANGVQNSKNGRF